MEFHRRPSLSLLLITLLVFQGVSGVAGGAGLVADPSGAVVGLPLHWLHGSPFRDYRVPGLILFGLLGVAPLGAAWGVLRRAPWARPAALAVGAALLAWLAVEIVVIGYQPRPPLQLVYGLVGTAILGSALHPSVARQLRREGAGPLS